MRIAFWVYLVKPLTFFALQYVKQIMVYENRLKTNNAVLQGYIRTACRMSTANPA